MDTKICKTCGEDKPLSDYYKRAKSKDGVGYSCRDCQREASRQWHHDNPERSYKRGRKWRDENPTKAAEWSRYGRLKNHSITADQYDALLASQGGMCANNSCRSRDPGAGRKNMCIDHDHSCCSGQNSCGKCIRGLLCMSCNLMLGHAKDRESVLFGLVEYLRLGVATLP